MYRIMSVFAILVITPVSLNLMRAQEPPPGQAQAKEQTKGESKAKPAAESSSAVAKTGEAAKEKKESSKGSTDEEPVVTHHTVRVAGRDLKYSTTAGLIPIKDAKGEVEARIFFMAHVLDDAKSSESRPLLFSFNGGPGSASVWLHLGALGPRRVQRLRSRRSQPRRSTWSTTTRHGSIVRTWSSLIRWVQAFRGPPSLSSIASFTRCAGTSIQSASSSGCI